MSTKSFFYLSVQVLSIAFLLVTGNFYPENNILKFIEVIAVLVGAWAIWAMRNHFNVFPEVRSNAEMLLEGPYAFVRHPMYSVQYLIGAILIIDSFSFSRLVAYIFLCLALTAKTIYEEKLLSKAFPTYENYKTQTKAIIPFLF